MRGCPGQANALTAATVTRSGWLFKSHCLALWQDLAEFKARLLRFLAHCERELLPFCPARAPELLMAALELVANTARLHLLAARLPAALILQLHTLAHCLASVRLPLCCETLQQHA